MLLQLVANAVAIHLERILRLGVWALAFVSFTGTISFYFIEVVSFYFIEAVYFYFIEVVFCSYNNQKKPLAVFIINTCLYEKALLYPMFRRILILCFVEKLLIHPMFHRKI